ncbi:DsbA family protein [Pseudonocardia acidicola]|uniref:DSBA-like thioredoxin domain-containing protein n=1 Tax=Pseudonocardia acidicola TaxID=2724939 RepID=A0ABX1S565_9PSEU|nr:DsbA family protein [Pseudonocardia acidicola]NMH96730.1 hypothetical protein [Pseudonocardia acidicola]
MSTSGAEIVEFFFDPTCPFAWVTSRWVVEVARQRPVTVRWRPLSLKLLNEPLGYDGRPADYPDAHQRGLEMLRVVHAARERYGEGVVGDLYTALGEEIWHGPAPDEATFEAVLAEEARPRDLAAVLRHAGLDPDLAAAAHDTGRDEALRAETLEAVNRAGGGVGTPVLTFDPPDGPSFFGPVIEAPPAGEEALRLWDAVRTLAEHRGFAELKRAVRAFPRTPMSARIAGEATRVG